MQTTPTRPIGARLAALGLCLLALLCVLTMPAQAVTATASVGDRVWLDNNGNGVQDAGETGVPNLMVFLYRGDGTIQASIRTDANGNYRFSNLLPGTYQLKFTNIYGAIFTDLNKGTDDAIDSDCDRVTGMTPQFTLAEGETNTQWDAGTYKAVMFGNVVWYDLNANGIQDASEPRVPNVPFKIYNGDGALLLSSTTNASGVFEIYAPPGSYRVEFTAPAAYTFTQPYQGTDPTLDSDVDPATGSTPVFSLTSDQIDCTRDAGLVTRPLTSGLLITKVAGTATIVFGQPVTYTYRVTNTGGTVLTNIVVTDDNGTPAILSDDFTVGTVASLSPGEVKTLTATVYPQISMWYTINGIPTPVGSLTAETLASGDIKICYSQSRAIVDNTYGSNAVGYAHAHSFRDFIESDQAQFQLTDANGDKVLDFTVDYLSASPLFPSGYGSLGVSGDEGQMLFGNAAHILSATTSMTTNLNQSPGFYGYTVNSPAEPNTQWDYVNSYTLVISKAAFGRAGFGGVTVPIVHNSPSKTINKVYPVYRKTLVVNTATAIACIPDGDTLTTIATAEVLVTPPASNCLPSTITAGFNSTPISAGRTIWFASMVSANGLGQSTPTVKVKDAKITFSANGSTYDVPVPDGVITFSNTATQASTTFDAVANTWYTVLPQSTKGDAFVAGVAIPVPANLPGGITPVSWQGVFISDTPGVKLNWKWAASVYTQFTTDYTALGVAPLTSGKGSGLITVGTPKNYGPYLTGGALGGGYSSTSRVTPCIGLIDED